METNKQYVYWLSGVVSADVPDKDRLSMDFAMMYNSPSGLTDEESIKTAIQDIKSKFMEANKTNIPIKVALHGINLIAVNGLIPQEYAVAEATAAVRTMINSAIIEMKKQLAK